MVPPKAYHVQSWGLVIQCGTIQKGGLGSNIKGAGNCSLQKHTMHVQSWGLVVQCGTIQKGGWVLILRGPVIGPSKSIPQFWGLVIQCGTIQKGGLCSSIKGAGNWSLQKHTTVLGTSDPVWDYTEGGAVF